MESALNNVLNKLLGTLHNSTLKKRYIFLLDVF